MNSTRKGVITRSDSPRCGGDEGTHGPAAAETHAPSAAAMITSKGRGRRNLARHADITRGKTQYAGEAREERARARPLLALFRLTKLLSAAAA